MRSWQIKTLKDQSGGASVSGAAIPADMATSASVQASFTGTTTLVATLQLQGSNDMPPSPSYYYSQGFVPTNWTDITSGSVAAPDPDAAVSIQPLDVNWRWLRLKYTYTSGTGGTFTATLNLQGRAA